MLVVRKHQKLLLNLRDPDKVLTVIPTAQKISHGGRNLVVVPHKLDEVKVLRNLGMDAPMPMRYYYNFPSGRGLTPFEHQYVTSDFLIANPKAFCLNDMGTGKTLSGLWAFDYLRQQGYVNKMLVISPLSTLERTWGDEIFTNFPDMNFAVLHGTREKRHKLLDEDFDVYVINHDGIKAQETLDRIVAKKEIDLVVVDEIASFRNAQTDRWKALRQLVASRTWVWGLTGTPTPNAPTDAWAQCRLIAPAKVPPYFSHFRDSVMKPVTKFKWAPRAEALEIVKNCMQPAVRFSREECIDLPPTTYVTRHVALSPEQNKMYHEMLRKFKTELGGTEVTAVNEAVKLGKLLQICCGVAYGKTEDVVIPSHARIALAKEIVEEAQGKVIVFVPLTGALENVAKELRAEFTVEVVHGETPRHERDRIFGSFQRSRDPRVLVATPGTMSHGLTLTASNTIIWFGPTSSNETYQQANARIVRPGQTLNTLIVHIEGTNVERQIYQRLQSRGKMQGILLDMLKGESL